MTYPASSYTMGFASSPGATFKTGWTVSLWFKLSAIPLAGSTYIIRHTTTGGTWASGAAFGIDTTGRFFISNKSSGVTYINATSTSPILDGGTLGQWNHLVFHGKADVTGLAGGFALYLNDVQVAMTGTWNAFIGWVFNQTGDTGSFLPFASDADDGVFEFWDGRGLQNVDIIATPSLRSKFISSSGERVDLGTRGEIPTGGVDPTHVPFYFAVDGNMRTHNGTAPAVVTGTSSTIDGPSFPWN